MKILIRVLLVLGFTLALRASLARHREAHAAVGATSPAAAARPSGAAQGSPPWAEGGFRDDERCDLVGEPPECR